MALRMAVEPLKGTSPENRIFPKRTCLLRRGLTLAAITVGWNVLEGAVALWAGLGARSVALVGFGVDSLVETTSASVLVWRLSSELKDAPAEKAEEVERRAARIAGSLLLVLALYIVIDAGERLVGWGREAQFSLIGAALAGISAIVMPVLGWSKLNTAKRLKSSAFRADAYETITCAWLSLTTLAGLLLNATLGWHWADPVAALLLVPLIVREGLESLRGESEER
jgi:divalent metal cation (Fe/Co/Zn/Cd) transporter